MTPWFTCGRWREYLIEAVCLGLFMVSAAVWATLLQHPASLLSNWLTDAVSRRVVMGLAMGSTAVALIQSPLGARTGAHMNPAVTLAFLRIGKLGRGDAAGYVLGQFLGGSAGILVATVMLAGLPSDPSVNYVATVPGPLGAGVAFLAEAFIAFLMMTLILTLMSQPSLSRFTGLGAGLFVAICIIVEAPLSGMSMNPARSLGSNLLSHTGNSLWIYFTAPVLGMWLAAELHARWPQPLSSLPYVQQSC